MVIDVALEAANELVARVHTILDLREEAGDRSLDVKHLLAEVVLNLGRPRDEVRRHTVVALAQGVRFLGQIGLHGFHRLRHFIENVDPSRLHVLLQLAKLGQIIVDAQLQFLH